MTPAPPPRTQADDPRARSATSVEPEEHRRGVAAHRHTRRWILGTALGGALLTVVSFAVLATPAIERALALAKLERSPELFESWLVDANLSPAQQAALDQHLRDDTGKARLLALFLEDFDAQQFPALQLGRMLDQLSGDTPTGFCLLTENHCDVALTRGRNVRSSASMINPAANLLRRRAILARLDALVGEPWRVSSRPNVEFFVVPLVDQHADRPPWNASVSTGKRRFGNRRATHVCYFRRVGDEPSDPKSPDSPSSS